jgi:alpha-tubulin suppressor-like RCC1 family protein
MASIDLPNTDITTGEVLVKPMNVLRTLLATPAIVALACSDGAHLTDPVPPGAPAFVIGDAARGFKQGFYWLPPMVRNPITSGTFDAELSPVVEICALNGDSCDPALDLVETFTTEGSGSTTIRVSSDDGHYIVNWHLHEYDLSASTHYRISVFAGPGVLLGYADVEPVTNGREMKNVDTGEYIALVDNRTLPIKFRIETGMVAGISIDPAEATVAPGQTQQFTATITDLHGNALAVPVDWTSDDESVATVDAGGAATGVGPGSTAITATVDHESASATFTVEVEPEGGWAQLSAGFNHTCGVTALGEAFCWGRGSSGQLGTGGTGDVLVPVAVAGNHRFASISAGGAHTCGLTTDGETFCWGLGGRIGDGGTDDQLSPAMVAGDHRFASITAGLHHTCGLTTGGEGFCWGNGSAGKLGNGGTDDQLSPAPVTDNLQFASISAGSGHTCGVTTDGDAFCWGDEFLGALGNGDAQTVARPSPVAVLGDHQFTSISAGVLYTCGVTTDGEGFCWGNSARGQLGNGVSGPGHSAMPVAVLGDLLFTSITTGRVHTCGLTADGEGFCWGAGGVGGLGNGATDDHLLPTPVAGNLQFASLSVGDFQSCGLAGEEAYCWGLGSSGQLGNGDTVNRLAPVRVADPF